MLDPIIKQKLLTSRDRCEAQGRLLARNALDGYFACFRQRFGPDELARANGIELLELMHGRGNNESLVYWLEFKNDDELPSVLFGGIGGGSAFKYGLFYRKETGQWMAPGPTPKGHEISLDEAVTMATSQRDEMLLACGLFAELPTGADDAEYAALQRRLDEAAPTIADSAWGHKYFYFLFPDKLDDFHSPVWQRFYLLKMLQTPPAGGGRYVCAGRYVQMSLELELPMHNTTFCVCDVGGSMHKYWRINFSDGRGTGQSWTSMHEGNYIALGWPEAGDLSGADVSREQLARRLAERKSLSSTEAKQISLQLLRFAAKIGENDLVLACDGDRALGICRVTGDYVYEPTEDCAHRRPAQWLTTESWTPSFPAAKAGNNIVQELRKVASPILDIERRLQSGPTKSPARTPSPLTATAGRIESILERKCQVVLYGPPGTGKTFWAEKTARELAARSAFGKAFSELADDKRQIVVGTDSEPGLVRFCCFHPSYGYEDFIEGYRPESKNGNLTFSMKKGIFWRLCDDARRMAGRRFYLIVDEINRGDIPRIFGELLTLIEKDKRGKRVTLPVSGEAFLVPPNVYLIGTMNTADRSISLLDTALRRRFGFVELMPDADLLKGQVIDEIPLAGWLDALNDRIRQHVGRDARNLQVGHAYLMQAGRPVNSFAAFKRVVRDDILPLLEEYCYEDFSTLQQILGKCLVDLKHQRLRYELFDTGSEKELIPALRELIQDSPVSQNETVIGDTEDQTDEEDSEESDEA